MAVEVIYDIVPGHEYRESDRGTDYVRPVLVKGLALTGGETAADVIGLARSYLPSRGTPHESPSLAGMTVADVTIRSINESDNSVVCGLVYRSPGEPGGSATPTWQLDDEIQTSTVQSYTTATGAATVQVFYGPGKGGETPELVDPIGGTVFAAPADTKPYSLASPRVIGGRVVRISSTMTRAQWDAIKTGIRAASLKLNNDFYGPYDRGQILFYGPRTRISQGGAVTVELSFSVSEYGFYPFAAFVDPVLGVHPKDSAAEKVLRDLGPPPVGGYWAANGIAISSQQEEISFNGSFPAGVAAIFD